MMAGIIGITPIFVPVFFGNEFEKVTIILPLLSLLYIPTGLKNITGVQYLISTGQQNKYTKMLLVGLIINIIIGFCLIPSLGAIGATIAVVIGELSTLICSLIYLQKSGQYNIKNIFKSSQNYIIAGLIMYMLLFWIRGLIILVFLGIAIYFIILMLLKDEFFVDVIVSIKNKIMYKLKSK